MKNNFVVYMITFTKRLENNIKPYYYIGSKSKCNIIDGVIFDKKDNAYWGSSTCKTFKKLLQEGEEKHCQILSYCMDFASMIDMERKLQEVNDVVADTRFFNKAYASKNNYSNPEYATYKNLETGKIARLPRNHIKVLNGEWVGVTKGVVESEHRRREKSKKMLGEKNHFFGKTHSNETKNKILQTLSDYYQTEDGIELRKSASLRMIGDNNPMRKNVMSESHKESIRAYHSERIMLKNKISEEARYFKKNSQEFENLDRTVWVRPYILRERGKIIKCPYCDKEGEHNNSAFRKWHFENCKHKQKEHI